MAQRDEIVAVYAAGLIQGIALVTFPAASAIFTSPEQKKASPRGHKGDRLRRLIFVEARRPRTDRPHPLYRVVRAKLSPLSYSTTPSLHHSDTPTLPGAARLNSIISK
jgi:hypothetical protein